jgi:hypothetical protein
VDVAPAKSLRRCAGAGKGADGADRSERPLRRCDSAQRGAHGCPPIVPYTTTEAVAG